MGGRGATLITQSKREDEGTLIQDERLKKMLQSDDPETEYHNGMFRVLKRLGWSTRQSTDKNQDVKLMDQQDVVRDITKEYSKFFKNTVDDNEIRLRSLPLQKVGVLGVCWAPPDKLHRDKLQMHIAIDKKYIDSSFAEKYQKISGRDNFNVPIHYLNSDKYVTTHEMGHALENSILYKKHNNYYTAFNMNKKLDANVIKDDVVKLAERELHRKLTDQEIHLSEYSRKNSREWFAETFTNLELANEPEPIAKALKLYLERLK